MTFYRQWADFLTLITRRNSGNLAQLKFNQKTNMNSSQRQQLFRLSHLLVTLAPPSKSYRFYGGPRRQKGTSNTKRKLLLKYSCLIVRIGMLLVWWLYPVLLSLISFEPSWTCLTFILNLHSQKCTKNTIDKKKSCFQWPFSDLQSHGVSSSDLCLTSVVSLFFFNSTGSMLMTS